jgi:hypothetical protein
MMENYAAVHPMTSMYWCHADRLHTKLALVNGVLKAGHSGRAHLAWMATSILM